MTEAKEKKDAEIDSLNRELSEYIQQMADLSENSKIMEKQLNSYLKGRG